MSLRDQFTEDLDIFFNQCEMAAEHDLQGRRLLLVTDNDQLQKNALQAPGGLYDGDFLVFVKTSDLAGLQVAPGRTASLDGRPYLVSAVVDEDGVTQITFSAAGGGY